VLDADPNQPQQYYIPDLYQHQLDQAVKDAQAGDPRLKHPEYTPGVDAASRRLLNSTSPVTKAAHRRLRSLEAGEPQLIPVASINPRWFPDAAKVPFIAAAREVPDTAEEHDEQCSLVRVYADERVEVGQRRWQMREQGRLVGQGFTVGEIDDNGDYCPLGYDPETGFWQPIGLTTTWSSPT
jgi:hypothetical protein